MRNVILFDLDDTLIAQDACDDTAFHAVCDYAHQQRGVNARALDHAVRPIARQLWRDAPTSPYTSRIGISYTEGLWGRFSGDEPALRALHDWAPTYRREAWSHALVEQGVEDAPLAEELSALFGQERRARRFVFPDTAPALRGLRADYHMGLVTNGAPDLQREKLVHSGLEPFFDAILVSGEVNVGKPDPRIFMLALERLGARPEEAAMVGDSPARDIAGAQRAGVRAVMIKRPGLQRDLAGIAPDAEIATLDQLRAVL
jgi:putative hydrolase of the HAD superfamily